ncbi:MULTISPECIES: MFS transporter [Rhizobium]|uniref:Solute carrier family 22 member 6 Organic anion transporter 1 n=1 Tax=Rhizobium favelukesii TaxID=348824 RepID=W6RE76_9HYPH|nr:MULTISPECIES: MFS transporter [Rhizobium]MCA0802647.1 MFS transporter [Rhizobium sp. T1473]MCS0457547.1 MFS transporter [Rhizobium favelukesii]UFS83766.1 MFS transporter [Rhizobium sp. T136]CDM58610.1 Solute carrier family 22 member 6 Organic anion transporter 1 [Rhizobium favelukesii]
MSRISMDEALDRAGTGSFQRRLIGIFGLVWTADAMQVLAVGFTAASIAATFGLTVPQALQTGTLFFLGMLIGAVAFGRLADKVGRRQVLIATVACDALFGTLSIFAADFTSLLVLRFLTGMAVGGTLPVDYAMMAEFLPTKSRGRWLVALEGFWAIGTLIVALAAWAASVAGVSDPWRYIFAVTALPALLGLTLRFFVPESPLYLIRTGRTGEAKMIVNRMLALHQKAPLRSDDEIVATPQVAEGIFSEELRRRSALILAIWFLVSVSYYGVFTWMPAKLAGDGFGFVRGYGFLVFVALAQVPGYALAAYGVEAWGRRPTLICFCLLSALGCLLFVVSPSDMLVGASLLVMSFALLGTWGALYAFTPELYPTASRATGMGSAGAMARLGGLLAPSLMAFVVSGGLGLAIGLFAGLLVVAAFAAMAIDAETRQAALS